MILDAQGIKYLGEFGFAVCDNTSKEGGANLMPNLFKPEMLSV